MAKKQHRDKQELIESVESLQGNINSVLDNLDEPIEHLFPTDNLLPGLEINYEKHDYEKDIELIKIDSKETLNALANLYLTDDVMKNKNIYKIIKNDAESLTDLNFSIATSKRALISCMGQLDMGVNDPLMYQSVAMFQKEMRDTIKLTYDIQKKMKEFYKELKTELEEINSGDDYIKEDDEETVTVINDKDLLKIFEEYQNNPNLLDELNK